MSDAHSKVMMISVGFVAGALCLAFVSWLNWPAEDRTQPAGFDAHSSARTTSQVDPAANPAFQPFVDAPQRTADSGDGAVDRRDTQPLVFAPGEVVLRIGDRYRFGSPTVVADNATDTSAVKGGHDLICFDLRGGRCVLGTPGGSEQVYHPRIVVGNPPTQPEVFDALLDAPDDLSEADEVTLYGSVSANERTGVVLIRARDGRVYKARIVEEERATHALDRSVVLAYAELPTVPDGGAVRMSSDVVTGVEPVADIYTALRDLRKLLGKMPGRNHYLRVNKGQLIQLDFPPHDLVVTKDRHLVLGAPLLTSLQLDHGGLIYAEAGIGRAGELRYSRNAGVVVLGEMAGNITAKSSGTICIDGNLTGVVRCQRGTTLVVFGDLYGTVHVDYRTTVVVRGEIIRDGEWLQVGRRGGGDIYLEGYYSRDRIENFPGSRAMTLHVEESDLKKGRHSRLAGFRNVVVGDRAWNKFPQ
ncbi:MAG: hypothetical protein AAF581_05190 [Planctomycetota bacterium]